MYLKEKVKGKVRGNVKDRFSEKYLHDGEEVEVDKIRIKSLRLGKNDWVRSKKYGNIYFSKKAPS